MARITDVALVDEAGIVEIICELIDLARDHITTEASWARLVEFFYQQLLHEKVLPAAVIVAWAEAGHPAAHRAIRRFGREMKERSRFDDMLVSVRAYVIKTDDQPFVPFPRGRHLVANMMRDIWLPALMQRAADALGFPATRSATATTPSIAHFVHLAMKKKGIKLSERQLNRIHWNRNKLAAELEASMPLIPASTIKENI
jgi:hypothetical protein